jgi:hypothetical protein
MLYCLLVIQYFNMNRNEYNNCVLQNLSSEPIILKFYYKIYKRFYCIKHSNFMRSQLLYFRLLSVPLKILLRATFGTRVPGCRRLV